VVADFPGITGVGALVERYGLAPSPTSPLDLMITVGDIEASM